MKHRAEFPMLWTLAEIEREISEREALLPTLVGNLYPMILLAELIELRDMAKTMQLIVRMSEKNVKT